MVSSKVFFPVGDGPNDRGLSRKHIVEQLNRSLKNLQVDYLDLYFCHRFDPETCMEETLETLSDMVAQGKILYYGVSEWSPVQITKALGLIQKHGYRPLSVIQPQYNMVDRYIEDEIMGDLRGKRRGVSFPSRPCPRACSQANTERASLSRKAPGQPIRRISRSTSFSQKKIWIRWRSCCGWPRSWEFPSRFWLWPGSCGSRPSPA